MKERLDLDSEMKYGPPGSFEITVNGKAVVTKRSTEFPSEQQIVEAVARELGP